MKISNRGVLRSKGEREMKPLRIAVAIALVALIAAAVFVSVMGATAGDVNNDSGIAGLRGPEFTLGVFMAGSVGNNPNASSSGSAVFNGAPFALSGYVMSMTNGSVHVWITESSQVVKDLGFKVGDVVPILCSASQVKDLKTGDFVTMFGFTARGYLVRSDDTILPAPFSY
jgi:hypothetical protein